MDLNNILPVVLAGGQSKRFGCDKSQVKLGKKILIDYILSEIIGDFKEVEVIEVLVKPGDHINKNDDFDKGF